MQVPEQPLFFTNNKGQIVRYNLRKLSELPYHLNRSHRYEDLHNEVIFNVSFLNAKLSSAPLTAVIAGQCTEIEQNLDRTRCQNMSFNFQTKSFEALLTSFHLQISRTH